MRSFRINLIRCGTTEMTEQGRCEGSTDKPLTASSSAALRELKNDPLLAYPEAGVLFCSPYLRCRQTAEILFPDTAVNAYGELTEYGFGSFEGMTRDELSKMPEYAAWVTGGADAAPPGGESSEAFAKRLSAVFTKLTDKMMVTSARNVTIITTGGVIMSLMASFAVPVQPMNKWITMPGRGFTVRTEPMLWNVRKWEWSENIPYDVEDTDEQ
ncbi:MAG: histidine phosphatase family protein [Clostridia bacterium]|nr:histidine phosphatase family protein [Clostridia bacterium]